MTARDRVDLRVEPGLYELVNRTGTQYYVDARRGKQMQYLRRPRGEHNALRLDGVWQPLLTVLCLPRSHTAQAPAGPSLVEVRIRPWLLDVGHAHLFVTHLSKPGPGPSRAYGVKATPAVSINAIDKLPALAQLLLDIAEAHSEDE
ncbi:hypothetical protein QQX10_10610 [Demequina sp. SYSU T00039]|uniref:Uncharacterized protein n=1 Tax=Demequina lignilytica TaxID=3051663 RepID=A0AAW7M624_9MICO|nr:MULTISPECIES: hypothetical protein [unclassified Demequina]MDN4478640.1 hypothetical protein [Demequina sp. SYSU T00039-1]MDN4488618.1 hypothetical protein [Demequina sp. SYSU T00039]